jgi:hypothetical protein
MIRQIKKQSGFFFLVSFALLFLWGSAGWAKISPLEGLYAERTKAIEKINLLREKVQQDVHWLQQPHSEYLLSQGSIHFVEDEKAVADLHLRLKQIEGQIISLSERDHLPKPAWAAETQQDAIYSGSPLLAFDYPVGKQIADEKPPIAGGAFLMALFGGIMLIFLSVGIWKIFRLERGVLYPCLLIRTGRHRLEPLYISSRS